MEKLKDPAMLLSVANSIGLVGTTAYFYKQLEAIRLDMVKMSQTLTGVLRKLSEMEKGEQHKGEALHTLNDQIKHINEQIEELPSFDTVDNIDFDLSEIITVLEEHNIRVERPSQQQRPRRSGDRRVSSRRDTDMDDRRDISSRRVTVRSSDRSRSDTSRDSDARVPVRQPVREPVRESVREPVRESRAQQSRSESRLEPATSYEDDADLIGEVRRQQTRS
jgi:TolA-binding protein